MILFKRWLNIKPICYFLLFIICMPAFAESSTVVNITPLGQFNFPTSSFFSAVKGDYAYVGPLSINTGNPASDGITVLNVKDPANPVQVARLGNTPDYVGSLLNGNVIPISVNNSYFKGDILVVGIQNGLLVGGAGGTGGLGIWNISDPKNPTQMAFLPVFGPLGAHEVQIFQQGSGMNGHIYALVNSLGSEFFSILLNLGGIPVPMIGDLQFVDITDPNHPALVADWGMQKDGGFATGVIFGGIGFCVPQANCRGATMLSAMHSSAVSKDGNTAYVTMEDQGAGILDISDLHHIKLISHLDDTLFNSEGDDDHIAVSENGKTLMVTSETAYLTPAILLPPGFPQPAYPGAIKFWDISDPKNPKYLTTWSAPILHPSLPGSHTARIMLVRGNVLYVSWYSDGVYMLDISDPSHPTQIGSYLPDSVNGSYPSTPGICIDQDKIYITNGDLGSLVGLPIPYNGVSLYIGRINITNSH